MPHYDGERPSLRGSEEAPFQAGASLERDQRHGSRTAEAPDVVARLLADRSVWRPIVVAIERRKPTIAVVCGRGSSGHVGVFLRYLMRPVLHSSLRNGAIDHYQLQENLGTARRAVYSRLAIGP